jgi:hypothetical protein
VVWAGLWSGSHSSVEGLVLLFLLLEGCSVQGPFGPPCQDLPGLVATMVVVAVQGPLP